MIIIYNKEKEKVQELVDKILQEHPEYGKVTVIGDLSELPENIKINEVVDIATGVTDTGVCIPDPDRKVISDLVGDLVKRLEDVVEIQPSEYIIQEFEKAYKHHIPEVSNIEEFVKENKTEFQKLSSFNRKEKNQARRKLEHRALKYQNKHWKK